MGTSSEFAASHSSVFGMTQTETYETSLRSGVVWQFQVMVIDNCGTTTVRMKDFQVTQDNASPPCCLPGYFKDAAEPTGDCLNVGGEKYNLCEKDLRAVALV